MCDAARHLWSINLLVVQRTVVCTVCVELYHGCTGVACILVLPVYWRGSRVSELCGCTLKAAEVT